MPIWIILIWVVTVIGGMIGFAGEEGFGKDGCGRLVLNRFVELSM